jgi:YbbR domain-containing protein
MKKHFFENLGFKIVSVLLAVMLWFFVTSRGQSEMSIDVPLEYKNIPAGLEIVNHSMKTVTLNIKGQERFIKNIRLSDIRVPLDLSKAKKGEGIYYIDRHDIRLPRSISIMNINPASVRITTEETMTKTVRVLPLFTGEPARGYYIKSVEVSPQYVVIEGVRSEIMKIASIRTEPLDISGYRETTTQNLKLDLWGKNIRSKTNDVDVKMVIGARGR